MSVNTGSGIILDFDGVLVVSKFQYGRECQAILGGVVEDLVGFDRKASAIIN